MHAIESNFALLYAFFVGRIFGIRYETDRRYDDVEAWGTREGLWSHHGPRQTSRPYSFHENYKVV